MATLADIATAERRIGPEISEARGKVTGFCVPFASALHPSSSAAVRAAACAIGSVPTGSSKSEASERLASGHPVLVASVHHAGFLVFAAHDITTAAMALLVEHSSGFIHVALPLSRCKELQIPPVDPFDACSSRMCVGVDAVQGIGTGISAADRATTARRLLDPSAEPATFTRPGHLVPICIDDSEIPAPPSPAAIALALVQSAGLPPGAVFAELVSVAHPAEMMNFHESVAFAQQHNLTVVTYRTT